MTTGLYVTYSATVPPFQGKADGYVILRNRGIPKTQQEIEGIARDIGEAEGLLHVIPMTFLALDDVT